MRAPRILLIGPYDPLCGEYTFLAPPLGVWRLSGVLESAGVEVKVAPGSRVRPVRLVFFVRTVLVALLPLIAALGLLIAGIRFLGNNWSSAVVVLIGVSALSTVVWSGYRWWRRR